VSSKVQQLTLAGGLPGNGHQLVRPGAGDQQALSGRPISAGKALLRSFSAAKSEKYFRDNVYLITKMQQEGIPWRGSLNNLDTLRSFGPTPVRRQRDYRQGEDTDPGRLEQAR